MLDPVSVAGLALAVFDELLKVGAKTTEVISDMRSFDQVNDQHTIPDKRVLLTRFRILPNCERNFVFRFGEWTAFDCCFVNLRYIAPSHLNRMRLSDGITDIWGGQLD